MARYATAPNPESGKASKAVSHCYPIGLCEWRNRDWTCDSSGDFHFQVLVPSSLTHGDALGRLEEVHGDGVEGRRGCRRGSVIVVIKPTNPNISRSKVCSLRVLLETPFVLFFSWWRHHLCQKHSPMGMHSIGSNRSMGMRSSGGEGAGGGRVHVDDNRTGMTARIGYFTLFTYNFKTLFLKNSKSFRAWIPGLFTY